MALVVAAVGIALVLASWGRWLHPIVDFGRELYVPWQLLEGRRLAADLAYFNGPLSPWLNAAGFGLFGVGLRTLVGLNLVILVGVSLSLFVILRRFSRPTTVLVGLVVFLACFALADPTGSGTYNFIAPYSHEITHGFLLALLTLVLLLDWLDRPRRSTLFAVGLLTGLVFLTKSELFVATAPVVILAPLIARRASTGGGPSLPTSLGIVGGGALVPPLVAFALLLTTARPQEALAAVLGSWRFAFSPRLLDLRFYRGGMGLLDPVTSLGQLLVWIGISGVVLLPAWLLAWRTDPDRGRTLSPLLLSGLGTATLTALALSRMSVLDIGRPLPVVLALLAIGLAARLIGPARSGTPTRGLASGLLVTVFALLLLLKVLLRVRLSHYGFVLAAPAAMIAIWLLLEGAPRWLDQRGGSGLVFRFGGAALLAVVTLLHLGMTVRGYAAKTHPVGHGRDAFLADATGVVVSDTLDRLESLMRPGDSLAVLPEGVMLNYLLRRPNPTPYYNFMPPELVMFGEQAIVDAFEQRPPEWIVMTGRGATEYGFDYLGRGYGELLADWVRKNYVLTERVGDVGAPADPTVMSWAMILRRQSPD